MIEALRGVCFFSTNSNASNFKNFKWLLAIIKLFEGITGKYAFHHQHNKHADWVKKHVAAHLP